MVCFDGDGKKEEREEESNEKTGMGKKLEGICVQPEVKKK